ncbi:MAG: metallophosphoesterase, partial [Sphingomonas sp.]
MLIAQISDFHIVAPGQRAYRRIDPASMLHHAIEILNALKPQPELVIGSGDLVESGAPAEYAYLQDILKQLRAPFVPVIGNHDRRDHFIAAFGDKVKSSAAPFIQYVQIVGDIQVVV